MGFTPVTLLVGIALILGATALFFLDKIRPGYGRYSDKVYAVLLLIAGVLSLGHLTAGVTESFQVMLMAGMLFTLAIENIKNREAVIEPPMPTGRPNNYPPRPRYDDRPVANRRVYRAELDDRNNSLRDRSRPQRMAPGQDDYWPDDFNEQRRARQPYEEYRGPAARLQPSPGADNRRPPNNRAREAYPEERYGQRPPARPPAGQPPSNYPPQNGFDNGSMNRPSNDGRNGRADEGFDRGQEGDRDRSSEPGRERPSNGDRKLDIKPYSEAPKMDSPERPYS